MDESPQFSVFYVGGPLDGRCLPRSFREALQPGQTLLQILGVEPSSHRKWIEAGEAGPIVTRAEYEVTHINGLIAVARFVGNRTDRLSSQ